MTRAVLTAALAIACGVSALARQEAARGAQLEPGTFRYHRALPPAGGLVALKVDAAALAHSRGPAGGFADLRVVDEAGNQIPYVLEHLDAPLSLDLHLRPARDEIPGAVEPSTGNRSAYEIPLPYPNLPQPRVVLETSERVFTRRVQLGVRRPPDRRRRDPWFQVLRTAVWEHVDEGTAAPPLELGVEPDDATTLLLVVQEGDNRPLPITAVRLLLPGVRVRFFAPAGPLRLLYGREDISPPHYDLALLARSITGAAAREITAGPEADTRTPGAPIVSERTFWVFLAVAAAVLLALILRLMRSAGPPASHPQP